MPWLLALPGHQHPWYWLCGISRSLSYMRKDLNCLCNVSVEEWYNSPALGQRGYCCLSWERTQTTCHVSVVRNDMKCKYSVVPYVKHSQFSLKSSQETPYSSPIRVRYGVSFVSSLSDLYSAAAIAVLYVISWYIRPRYNDTWLCIFMFSHKNQPPQPEVIDWAIKFSALSQTSVSK